MEECVAIIVQNYPVCRVNWTVSPEADLRFLAISGNISLG
ncbi:hypothetical protein CKA32_004858 [Geitlerinema sp. FC II]|nr:hypothetical protein CKA32_004858 [Geitlerinema sp. FC II]